MSSSLTLFLLLQSLASLFASSTYHFQSYLLLSAMAAVAGPPGGAGAPGGGGGGGGLPPWRIFDGLEEVFINEEDFDEMEDSEQEEEWADYQHRSKAPPGLRWCKKCKYYTYLRKGGCANPECVLFLIKISNIDIMIEFGICVDVLQSISKIM